MHKCIKWKYPLYLKEELLKDANFQSNIVLIYTAEHVLFISVKTLDFHVNMHLLVFYTFNEPLNNIFRIVYRLTYGAKLIQPICDLPIIFTPNNSNEIEIQVT